MSVPPSGTVTFLFTDIEGSTRLAQQHGAAWSELKASHHSILRETITSRGGYVFQVIGDAFCGAFHTAPDALAAALEAQRALIGVPLTGRTVQRVVGVSDGKAQGVPLALHVRMGIHTGAATARPDGDYEGYLTLVRVQRIMSAAHGGQVLLSQSTADLVADALRDGVVLRDLGTHRLKDLGAPEHLHQLLAPDLPADFPPLKTADHPNNLPRQLSSFIGREQEVAELRRLLPVTSLLTLTGAGGVGKTRLALQVATGETASFPDGIWFVELAPLADPALIANTLAAAAGVREEPNRPLLATLGDHFHARSALIVLDNCEHLIADAAQVCDTLLHAAPEVKVIATSREALGIAGETAYRVPSLSLPPAIAGPKGLANPSGLPTQYESTRLFVDRAKAAKSDFAFTAANAAPVTQICRRLDGIPLAIELAAARIKVLSPEQIAARLDDRFRLLTGGSRTAMPRQQTLRAAVDWSYSLLTEAERVLLRRLSVFAGGWTLEAAEAVCSDAPVNSQPSTENSGESAAHHGSPQPVDGLLFTEDVLDLLTHLVDKSLVVVETTEDAMRYRMLETVRQYAREKLFDSGEGERLRNRHLAYFTEFAETAGDARRNPATQIPAITAELDNLRIAMTWALDQGTADGLRLIGAVAGRLRMLGNSAEAYDWLVAFLARDTAGATISRVRALSAAGVMAANLPGKAAQGQSYAQEGVALGRQLGDKSALAFALASAAIFMKDDNAAQAQDHLEEALRLALEIGEPTLAATIHNTLGEFWRSQGEDTRARFHYEQSLALFRSAWGKPGPAVLLNLALIAVREGDAVRARTLSEEALGIIKDTGARFTAPYALACLGAAAALRNQPALAVRLFGAAAAILERFSLSFEKIERATLDRHLALARSRLKPAAFDAAFAEGRAMPYDEAIAYALEGEDTQH